MVDDDSVHTVTSIVQCFLLFELEGFVEDFEVSNDVILAAILAARRLKDSCFEKPG